MGLDRGVHPPEHDHALLAHRSGQLRRLGRGEQGAASTYRPPRSGDHPCNAVCLYVSLRAADHPAQAHFGKFGSHYINRDFYFDVHPPLGKMLVGLAGLLSGYGGGFEFKSGVEYPEDVPYTAMRVFLASFGVMLVPIAWWTAGELGWSRWTRHWVTICVLCGGSGVWSLERVGVSPTHDGST
jgi:hypothetical protein